MKKRFEFCYLNAERRPNFAIVYDDDILSACERVLFRSVAGSDLVQTPNGTYLIRGWEPRETISVKEIAWDVSTEFTLGEREAVPVSTPSFALDLGELDLSKANPQ